MQETERKRGENGDLHLVATTGFVVLLCVVACGASRAVTSCWSNLCPGRSILCGILGGSMGADVGLNCMRACTYIYKKKVCAYLYIRPHRDAGESVGCMPMHDVTDGK